MVLRSAIVTASYASGPREPPLRAQTIGRMWDEAVAAHPEDASARLAPPGHPLELRRARRRGRSLRPRPARGRRSPRRPGRDLVSELRRVGGDAVRDRENRRDPRQRQPVVPGERARVRAEPVRLLRPDPRARVQGRGLRRARLVRAGPGAKEARPARPRVGRAPGRRHERGPRAARDRARLRPADQHSVHVRHDGVPQGRDPLPPQPPQQRLLHRRGARLHARRPRLRPRALLPLLRHGARQPRDRHPRRLHRHPVGGVRPPCRARGGRGRALHLALRGADDVHRRARGPGLRRASTCRACAPGSWPARRARWR